MVSSLPKDASTQDHEQDLSAIINSEERVELTLLIANICEIMRKQVADTFDASIDSTKQQALHVAGKNPNLDENQTHEETDEEKKARKLREKREKELSAPKMLELKEHSLEFFDKWRESILARIGSMVNNPKEVVNEQLEKASSDATPDTRTSPQPKILRK